MYIVDVMYRFKGPAKYTQQILCTGSSVLYSVHSSNYLQVQGSCTAYIVDIIKRFKGPLQCTQKILCTGSSVLYSVQSIYYIQVQGSCTMYIVNFMYRFKHPVQCTNYIMCRFKRPVQCTQQQLCTGSSVLYSVHSSNYVQVQGFCTVYIVVIMYRFKGSVHCTVYMKGD